MMNKRKLCIGLSLSHHLERTEGSLQSQFEADLRGQIDMAQKAEQAKLDFVFKADSMAAHPGLMKRSKGLSIDPALLFSVLSQATERIGLVTTASTSFIPPYVLARQLQSLQWLSNGRTGWNIVTSIDGFGNFGFSERPTAEVRYEMAAEATALVEQLSASYSEARQAPVHHQGTYFSVEGPLNVAAHPSGNMPLFQAGASEWGREFASSTADAVFAATPDRQAAAELAEDLRRRAVKHGRKAEDIRILPGCYLFIAPTRQEAEQMYIQAHAHVTEQDKFAKIEELLGTSLVSALPTDRVTIDQLPPVRPDVRSNTHTQLLRAFIEKEKPTVRDILSRPEVLHSAHWVVYGTPEEVAEEITEWDEAGVIDGLIAVPGGAQQSLELFLDQVIPILADRGRFRKQYEGTTLKEHLGILKKENSK